MSTGKAIVYIASTLDGYIAGENDDLSFLSSVEKPGVDYYGYKDFIKDIDTIIMGRNTYDWIMRNAPEFSHSDKETYIITHQHILSDERKDPNLKFYSGDLKHLTQLLLSEGKRIFIEGGSQIIHQLLLEKMIDEFIIAVVPVLIGKGIPLFKPEYPFEKLQLLSVRQFDTGLVMLHYSRVVTE